MKYSGVHKFQPQLGFLLFFFFYPGFISHCAFLLQFSLVLDWTQKIKQVKWLNFFWLFTLSRNNSAFSLVYIVGLYTTKLWKLLSQPRILTTFYIRWNTRLGTCQNVSHKNQANYGLFLTSCGFITRMQSRPKWYKV